ncbi:hypothetical protein BATDEDRAFT_88625 [Batrachochytrium dendrobatidis JAM81]|uniref:C2H2-type domain-containing protein n=2 Tax=Batrachochytrium dendrobatidis TaxID=109871 RepID=F4P3G4_BATDJ|nr:uncharacterized protein BATDEDRAFT_88625 [Batrachochytrium dendrobatidis JAM81]EGF80462.1 hypothetical protein BATDEDRAFT_88625 [Batrachochytrium dendrobatidis JAM81]OAJ41048.1 hypothetical protein BDEG_24703 [Batrachochytrium dendrobatidis JEL423]|eukprot:XP_006679290.1 hypothetical protein BATDEDRAFT_88625 [Batrachochytrium dendrobatidis JAM81]
MSESDWSVQPSLSTTHSQPPKQQLQLKSLQHDLDQDKVKHHQPQHQFLHPAMANPNTLLQSPVSPNPVYPNSGTSGNSNSSAPLSAGPSPRVSSKNTDFLHQVDASNNQHHIELEKLFSDTFHSAHVGQSDGNTTDATFTSTLLTPPLSALQHDTIPKSLLSYLNIPVFSNTDHSGSSKPPTSGLMLSNSYQHPILSAISITSPDPMMFQAASNDGYFDQILAHHTTKGSDSNPISFAFKDQQPVMELLDDPIYMHMMQNVNPTEVGIGALGMHTNTDILSQLNNDTFLRDLEHATMHAQGQDSMHNLVLSDMPGGPMSGSSDTQLQLMTIGLPNHHMPKSAPLPQYSGAPLVSPKMMFHTSGMDVFAPHSFMHHGTPSMPSISLPLGNFNMPSLNDDPYTHDMKHQQDLGNMPIASSSHHQNTQNTASNRSPKVSHKKPKQHEMFLLKQTLNIPDQIIASGTNETNHIQPKTQNHLTVDEPQRGKSGPFICTHPGCNKIFPSNIKLRSHAKSHRPRTFRCDSCHACFNRVHDLKRHQQSVHSVHRPFQCLRCCKTFSRLDALKRHTTRTTSSCYDAPIQMDGEHAAVLEAAISQLASIGGMQFPNVGSNGVMNAMDAMTAIDAMGGTGVFDLSTSGTARNSSILN